MIQHLVPEASVVRHNIFRRDIDVHLRGFEGAEETEAGIQPIEGSRMSTPEPKDPAKLDGSEPPSGIRSELDGKHDDITGVEGPGDITLDEVDNQSAIGDSASVTTVTIGDFFSSAWMGNEAYHLLERIQQESLSNKHGSTSKVLLAGYGFGGIVVKQVH